MEEVIKSTDTRISTIRLYRSGIMHQTYEDKAEIFMKDSSAEMEIYKTEYCNGQRRPILVDITNLKSVSKESRGIYSSPETARFLSAAALLVGNPVSRIIGNFYLGINKTSIPVKIFTRKNDAVSWLKTFLEGPNP